MKLVVIESPLSAPTPEGREENKACARRCMRHSLSLKEAPYAAHLTFGQPGLLDDAIPEERELGMNAGFAWGEMAELVAVYMDRGISGGMQQGIDRATAREIPIEYRRLES